MNCVADMLEEGEQEVAPDEVMHDLSGVPKDAGGRPTITDVEWRRFKSMYEPHKSKN